MIFSGSFGISPSEIVKILKDLSAYLNKDKNSICLALIIIDEMIGRWYRELNSFAVDQMGKQLMKQGQQLAPEDVTAAFSFRFGSDIENTVDESLRFLDNVKNRYDSGDLGRLVGQMNIVEIMKIKDLIGGSSNGSISQDLNVMNIPGQEQQLIRRGFKDLARNDTEIYNLDQVTKGFGGLQSVEKLQDWLRSLEKIKILINKIVFSQLTYLGCQQQMIDELRRKVFGR